MFIAKIIYQEYNHALKLELRHDNVTRLLEIISKLDTLEIFEVHINKEVK